MSIKKTLLILAAGQGSRYGGNKQTEWFGPNQEMIIDYSIYDAIKAGFNKIVFVIRQDFYLEFKKVIENRWKNKVELNYVFQSKEKYCNNENDFINREKPWGTGHAILCAKDIIKEPFLMINADDFYGRNSYLIASEFLEKNCTSNQYGLIAYNLEQTVSEYGTVSRGICKVNIENYLIEIKEHKKIIIKENKILSLLQNNIEEELNKNSKASMNFFCFHQSIFEYLQIGFTNFLKNLEPNNFTIEFLIPSVIDDCMKTKNIKVLVKNTNEKWFGVTYKEDAKVVVSKIQNLIQNNHYPDKL